MMPVFKLCFTSVWSAFLVADDLTFLPRKPYRTVMAGIPDVLLLAQGTP